VSHSKRLISLIGVQDIVVVDTPDALLVTTTQNAQRVKSVVDALKLSGRGDVLYIRAYDLVNLVPPYPGRQRRRPPRPGRVRRGSRGVTGCRGIRLPRLHGAQ